MADNKLLKTGVIGAATMIVCCFTPALVIIMGGLGLSAWVSGLDWILLPLLVVFIAMTAFALIKKQKSREQKA